MLLKMQVWVRASIIGDGKGSPGSQAVLKLELVGSNGDVLALINSAVLAEGRPEATPAISYGPVNVECKLTPV